MPSNVEKTSSKEFERLLKLLEESVENYRQGVQSAEYSVDRLLGVTPEDDQCDDGRKPSDDVASRLENYIQVFNTLNTRLHEVNERLESAV